jgi:hypothetical protein
MPREADVTIQIIGMGVRSLIDDFVESMVDRGWRTEVMALPDGASPGLFGVQVGLPEAGLVDLRSLVWDLRHKMSSGCYVHTHVHTAAPERSDYESLAATLSADAHEQNTWRMQTHHLTMDL